MRPCRKCGGTERNKTGECFICRRVRNNRYKQGLDQAHKDLSKLYHQAYYQSHKVPREPTVKAPVKDRVHARYKANEKQMNAYSKAWSTANPDKKEELGERSRLKKYGLTKDQYLCLLKKQGELCRICQKPFGTRIHIDHDHVTGRIRGLLCHNCNVGMGHFQDKAQLLRAAVAYLEEEELHTHLFVVRPPPITHRTDDRRHKVTDAMRSEMKELRGGGFSLGAIAKKVGLSRSWVQVVLGEV